MNLNNNNEGFQDIANSNYNLHWTFSNYMRWLMVCEQLNKLPIGALVLELGAGDSPLQMYMENNFRRGDLNFTKVDANPIYKNKQGIILMDITKDLRKLPYVFDCIVLCEVIEHLSPDDYYNVLADIYSILAYDSMLILTTPTPPYEGKYEELVWPDCHDKELKYSEIYELCNKMYEIENVGGWSLKAREYNTLLKENDDLRNVYFKIHNLLPESMIRSIIAMLSPIESNRQVIMICKKRRR